MDIKIMRVADIIPYAKNPRKNDSAVDAVAASIKEFGFKVPVVIDSEGVIVSGHTRVKAAKRLGIEEVPCVVADDLSPEQIKAFRLADNKVSEAAKWDDGLLAGELGDILNIDMSAFGFEMPDLEADEGGEPEVEFSEELREEHNYIVLYFDNEVDWLQAETLFNLLPRKRLSTRKDGELRKASTAVGLGRVLNGAKALEVLLRENQR